MELTHYLTNPIVTSICDLSSCIVPLVLPKYPFWDETVVRTFNLLLKFEQKGATASWASTRTSCKAVRLGVKWRVPPTSSTPLWINTLCSAFPLAEAATWAVPPLDRKQPLAKWAPINSASQNRPYFIFLLWPDTIVSGALPSPLVTSQAWWNLYWCRLKGLKLIHSLWQWGPEWISAPPVQAVPLRLDPSWARFIPRHWSYAIGYPANRSRCACSGLRHDMVALTIGCPVRYAFLRLTGKESWKVMYVRFAFLRSAFQALWWALGANLPASSVS